MESKYINQALCKKEGIPTSLFFEDFEKMGPKEKKVIISVCRQCPVMRMCREDALQMDTAYGVWGGAFFKRGKIVRDYVAA